MSLTYFREQVTITLSLSDYLIFGNMFNWILDKGKKTENKLSIPMYLNNLSFDKNQADLTRFLPRLTTG